MVCIYRKTGPGMANVRPRVRTASDWDELEFLVQSAGVPIEQAIGIEATTSQDSGSNSFREKLVVRGIGEHPLSFQFSAPSDLDVCGAAGCEFTEEPIILPPFLCLERLLEPEYVQIPSDVGDVVVPSEQDLQTSERLNLPMETDEKVQTPVQQPPSSSAPCSGLEDDHAVCELPSSPVHQTRKRTRPARDSSSDSDVIDLTQD